jgi:hypothetical protein
MMRIRNEHDNPKKVFKEQDDLVVPTEKSPEEADDKMTSVRRSEVTSIAPDDINWNNVYLGKQHGLHSIKPEIDSRKRRIV